MQPTPADQTTYIASNEVAVPFFCEKNTYIASNSDGNNAGSVMHIPLSVFSSGLSALEAITKFLKEAKRLRYCEIARLLNRDDRTIWDAYAGAQKKEFLAESSGDSVSVPLRVFSNREYSMLESLTGYLKEECNLRLCKIAALLNKDARTIWTVYSRLKKKRKNENAQQ